jgi:hypothetical protein
MVRIAGSRKSFGLTTRPARAYKPNMGGRVVVSGRIAAVVAPSTPPTFSSARIALRADQPFTSFQVGQSVSVIAEHVDGKYVAEKIILNDDRPLFGKRPT